jgi:hypothetical protein
LNWAPESLDRAVAPVSLTHHVPSYFYSQDLRRRA